MPNFPQSTTPMATFVANGDGSSLFESEFVSSSRETLNTPSIDPVFSMSTTPVLGVSPGFRSCAFRIAVPSLLFSIESAPAENVLLGLAVRAEKSAPEPTAVAIASRPSASEASVRLRLPRSTSVSVAACDGAAAHATPEGAGGGGTADGAAAGAAPPTAPAAGPPAVRSSHGRRPPSGAVGQPALVRPPIAAPSAPSHRRRDFILLPTAHLPRRRSVRRAR